MQGNLVRLSLVYALSCRDLLCPSLAEGKKDALCSDAGARCNKAQQEDAPRGFKGTDPA